MNFNPRVGDHCRCLQCRRTGRIGEPFTGAAFSFGADGVVTCLYCVDDVSSPCIYDVERLPDDGVDAALLLAK